MRLLLGVFLSLLATAALGQSQVRVTNQAQYPVNSHPVTASATGSTGQITATMAAVSGQTNWICGFVITSGGTSSALVVNATITGTVTATMNYTYVFVSSGQGLLGVAFPQCVPASATNTAITLTVPAGGTGTTVAAEMWGFSL